MGSMHDDYVPAMTDEEYKEAQIIRIERELNKLSLSKLFEFKNFGETKKEIAINLYNLAEKISQKIKKFSENGSTLNITVQPHVWKIIKASKVMKVYDFYFE